VKHNCYRTDIGSKRNNSQEVPYLNDNLPNGWHYNMPHRELTKMYSQHTGHVKH